MVNNLAIYFHTFFILSRKNSKQYYYFFPLECKGKY